MIVYRDAGLRQVRRMLASPRFVNFLDIFNIGCRYVSCEPIGPTRSGDSRNSGGRGSPWPGVLAHDYPYQPGRRDPAIG